MSRHQSIVLSATELNTRRYLLRLTTGLITWLIKARTSLIKYLFNWYWYTCSLKVWILCTWIPMFVIHCKRSAICTLISVTTSKWKIQILEVNHIIMTDDRTRKYKRYSETIAPACSNIVSQIKRLTRATDIYNRWTNQRLARETTWMELHFFILLFVLFNINYANVFRLSFSWKNSCYHEVEQL